MTALADKIGRVQIEKRNTTFIDDFSRENWEDTYQYRETDKDINDTHLRVAIDIASVEETEELQAYWADRFADALEDFKFVPGGRITSNAGTGLQGTTYINCFVSGPQGEFQDSMEGILGELQRQALILKSEGGYGVCADFMRPRGSFIHAIGNETPGAVEMLRMWDTQSAVITQGSGRKAIRKKGKKKIRKGAQMVTLSCWHPDIEEFITKKQTPGMLTKFNMSVLITDEFMEAVENHQTWRLEFPDFEASANIKREYNKSWNGDLKSWKARDLPVKVYREYEDANELWELIMESTYNRNEPGVLFVDTINRLNNLYYKEFINATNPSLRRGTKVYTRKGILPIEMLEDDVFEVQNLNGGWSPAKCFLSGKDQPLYRVTFKNGIEIFATAEHKWPVLCAGPGGFGKVTTLELQPGHKMPLPRNRTFDYEPQQSFSYDEGLMLGWLYGDGWITDKQDGHTEYGFLFGTEDERDILGQRIVAVVNQFKAQASHINPQTNGGYGFQVSAYEFEERMKSTYGVISKNQLPRSLWTSNDDFVKGFIDGLFSADGNVYVDDYNRKVQLTTSNYSLALEVQELLGFYGIKTTCAHTHSATASFPNEKVYDREYDCYDIMINGTEAEYFSTLIELSHLPKQDRLCQLQETVRGRRRPEEELVQVKSIEKTEFKEDVWDISVYDDAHCFRISPVITGNCGEQVLPPGGVCLLGSLNLTQFIDFEAGDWDYDKLAETIPIAIRFMDNVNDATNVPLKVQQENLRSKRRIGLGILGYGSALIMLKIRYGSEEALAMTERLMNFIMNTAYQASALLAKEKGAFPLFDVEKYLGGEFIKQLSKETKELIAKHGLRNSHLLSIQPTGNSSVLANNVSGGLEPVFMPDYIRTATQACPPDGLDLPKNIDWEIGRAELVGDWEWVTEGDENVLVTQFEGSVYKMDSNRGLSKEVPCRDYAVRYLMDKDEWEPEAHWAASTDNLILEDHIGTMKVFSRYIDSAMSKTVNLAHEYPYEDFERLYRDVHKTGTIKGCTTYREGTMTSVLSAGSSKREGIVKTDAPARPQSLPCDIHHLTYKGKKWLVIVGLWGSDPYEVFAFKTNGIELPKNMKRGILSKSMIRNRGKYDLECDSGLILKDVAKYFDVDEEETVTRCISMALRHGVDIEYVVDQLLKAHGTIASFNKVIARTLKKYLNGKLKAMKCFDCGSSNMRMQEGCLMCCDCGMSKCQ